MRAPVTLRSRGADLSARIERIALDAGVTAVGVGSAGRFEEERVLLERRKAAGVSADMQFTYRDPARSTDPQRILDGAESIIVGALAYRRSATSSDETNAGTVARYAREDFYGQLRHALEAVAAELENCGYQARVVLDDNAMLDRAAAYRAGLGWFGKNANLLLPGVGSWFILGSVVTDASLVAAQQTVADGCGTCERCAVACPTGAIVEPGVIDAGKCLAWLAQRAGSFPRQYRKALGNRMYGCDVCQEVCPINRLDERRRVARPASESHQATVPLLEILALSDDELLAQYSRWYIGKRDPDVLRRNALIALGNSGSPHDPDVVGVVGRSLRHGSPLLRAHAAWAARELGLTDLVRQARETETDPAVLDELEAAVLA